MLVKKILLGAGGLLLILVVGGLLLQKKGSVKIGQKQVREHYYTGKYINFSYLPKYKLETIATADGRVSTNVLLTVEGSERPKMLVTLRNANQELSELPEIQEKRQDKLSYTEEVARMQDLRGIMFRTADRKERTVFFKKGIQLLIVTLTADSADQVWDVELQNFLEGVEWK